MIPIFDYFLHPVLESINDGKEHSLSDIKEYVRKSLDIKDEDINETVKSGTQTKFYNRIQWATTYLKKAGFLTRPSAGVNVITPLGKKALASGETINKKYLRNHSSDFKEFIEKIDSNEPIVSVENSISHTEVTPIESIDNNFQLLNQELADELLVTIKNVSPKFFEHLVVDLLVKMGYGGNFDETAIVTQYSSDEGIDGIIKEDKLGLEKICLQAKHYTDTVVGHPEVQKFVGALAGQGTTKGVFITTSTFSKDAKKYKPDGVKLVLIDGLTLCKYMIEYNLGVSIRSTYEIKRIDTDYFVEE